MHLLTTFIRNSPLKITLPLGGALLIGCLSTHLALSNPQARDSLNSMLGSVDHVATAKVVENYSSLLDRVLSGQALRSLLGKWVGGQFMQDYDDMSAVLGSKEKHSPMENHNTMAKYSSMSNRTANWSQHQSLLFSRDLIGINVIASEHDGNRPENTIDGSLDPTSRWTAYGRKEWLEYRINQVVPVNGIKIAFHKGDERSTRFQIRTSTDDKHWQTVYDGESSGKTLNFESFTFKATPARFVRIVTFGNNLNRWNAITEVQLQYAVGENESGNSRQGKADPARHPNLKNKEYIVSATTNGSQCLLV